jgi:hypothetical protein
MARILGSGLLALAAFSSLSPEARAANGFYCQGTLAYPEGHYVCVGSQATADYVGSVSSLGLGPDRWDVGSASTGEVATSNFGASSAEVSVKVGVLSGKAHAEILTAMPVGEQDANFSSAGLATAAFRDTVLIQGQPGVPLGTPVNARLRTNVQGVFSSASAKNVYGAGADFTGQVYLIHGTGGQTLLPVPLSGFFSASEGRTGGTSDTLLPNVKTGDSLDIRWALRIEAFVNQVSTLPRTDSEIVARLFIDLEPTVAVAIGQTAYSYNDDLGEGGAGGEGGASGEGGTSGEGGENGEAAGSAGRDDESMGGASDSANGAGEGGEAGSDRAAKAGNGGANAGAGRAGSRGDTSPSSSGCSLSKPSDQRGLSLVLAVSSALLALVGRRRASRGPR